MEVDWNNLPVPVLGATGGASQTQRKDVKLLSCYNIVEDEKPSKAFEIAKKRLEKLEIKLGK